MNNDLFPDDEKQPAGFVSGSIRNILAEKNLQGMNMLSSNFIIDVHLDEPARWSLIQELSRLVPPVILFWELLFQEPKIAI